MNNYIKSFIAFVFGAMLLASCQNEIVPLASAVQVDKAELSFEGTSATPYALNVTADGDWFIITSAEWISVEPSFGTGNTEVTVKVSDNVDVYNELQGPRTGTISVCYGETSFVPVYVSQNGEKGLDASRMYTLVKSPEEITAGSYLLVFDDGGKYWALKAFSASSENTYSYLYADEVSVSDDVIVMPNANNSYTFSGDSESGYKIAMSTGRYLFQGASYDNFYSTEDIDKADSWSITLGDDGTAVVKNVTVSDKYIQYVPTYTSAGAYSAAQSGGLLPYLYKDSKPASSEILQVEENVSVIADAESVSIPVSSNATWKVRCHDEWIKSFTESGEGNGTIKVTFDQWTSKEEDRTASFLIIGETTNLTVVLTQNKVATNIAGLISQLVSTSSANPSPYSVDLSENSTAVVSYVNGSNVYIEDESAAILLYQKNNGRTAGENVSGKFSGTGYLYYGLPEITVIEGASFTEGGTVPCTEVTLAELLDNYDSYISRRVLVKGIKVSDGIDGSDRDGKIADGDLEVAVRAQSTTLELPVDAVGDILCFPSINNKTKQLSFYESEHFTAK